MLKRHVVFVSGLSGAGISSALKDLEDIGYEVFDNLPLIYVEALLSDTQAQESRLIAIGMDTRTRNFSPQEILQAVNHLKEQEDMDVTLLFMTCSDDVILRRYSETRRPHPLAKTSPVSDGIATERTWLQLLQHHADLVLDTSELSVHDLKRVVESHFSPDEKENKLNVNVMSFGFKNGLPREADMVLDVRFLRNPHWDHELRPQTGHDEAVREYISEDRSFEGFSRTTLNLLDLLLPRYAEEGKSYFTLAIGCTGGRHRSVFLAEKWAEHIREKGVDVTVRHRDLA